MTHDELYTEAVAEAAGMERLLADLEELEARINPDNGETVIPL